VNGAEFNPDPKSIATDEKYPSGPPLVSPSALALGIKECRCGGTIASFYFVKIVQTLFSQFLEIIRVFHVQFRPLISVYYIVVTNRPESVSFP
jgi:hypothetical protein